MPTLLRTSIEPLTPADINLCWALDQRCFADGEAYDHETFRYLLNNSQTLAYKLITPDGNMGGFVIGMIEPDGTGHVITLGVAPECRRRGYGKWLMRTIENGFAEHGVTVVRLEVRVDNRIAQNLYKKLNYSQVERLRAYYANGDDGFLMVKAINNLGAKRGR